MPQLDVTTWPPQLFWLAVTFFALYFIMSKLVIPRTGGVIEDRKHRIESDIAAAQRFKADTDAAIADYEKALADARGKAHAIAQETRNRLSGEVEAERSKLDAELAGKIAAAEKEIAAMRTKALESVAQVAIDIASDIVDRLTGSKASEADVVKAVAKARVD